MDNKKLIIFDLDGTLIDSVPDIARAVNEMLKELEKPTYSVDTIRGWVGNGGKILVKRALLGGNEEANDLENTDYENAFNIFLEKYGLQTCKETKLYPNVKETLEKLQKRGFKLAMATNKPEQFIQPILNGLNIASFFEICIGGDTLSEKKPNPLPLFHICKILDKTTDETVMVGDSKNDILAAHNANMDSIGLTYGYNYNEKIDKYNPTIVLSDFGKIDSVIK